MTVHKLASNPIHLGLNATAVVEPEFTGGMDWYMGYGERHGKDGVEGRLVSMHTFNESWDTWEVHPDGHEVVLCVAGRITLHQELLDGTTQQVTLTDGEYAVNDPGVWHTADVDGPVTALFITAGQGTQQRPR